MQEFLITQGTKIIDRTICSEDTLEKTITNLKGEYSVWELLYQNVEKSNIECTFNWDEECFILGDNYEKYRKGKNSLKGCKDLEGKLEELQETFETVIVIGHRPIDGECLDYLLVD